jgi:hypothetical protein
VAGAPITHQPDCRRRDAEVDLGIADRRVGRDRRSQAGKHHAAADAVTLDAGDRHPHRLDVGHAAPASA